MSLTALLHAEDDSTCDLLHIGYPSSFGDEFNPAQTLSASNKENCDLNDDSTDSNAYDEVTLGFNYPRLDSIELSAQQLDDLDRFICNMPDFQPTNPPNSDDQTASTSLLTDFPVPENPISHSSTFTPTSPSVFNSPLAEEPRPLSTALTSSAAIIEPIGAAGTGLVGEIERLAAVVDTPISAPLHVLSHAQRNPHIPSQQPREQQRRRLTEAEKASRALAAQVAQETRKKALAEVLDARKEFEAKLAAIAEQYHLNGKWLVRAIDVSSHMKEKKAPSDYNVLLHHKSKAVNASLDCGEKARPKELHALLAADTELLAVAEDKEKMEELRKQLMEYRAVKACGARVSSLSAAQDIKTTHEKLVKEFNNLHLRTGAVGFFFLSRGHKDCIGIPGWGMAGEDTDKFMRNLLDKEPWDILGLLEMWAVSRDGKKQVTGAKELCKECTTLIASKLRFITRKQNITMNYENYEEAVIHKHGVKLVGWPSTVNGGKVIKPSKLSASQLPDLHKALRLDACRWVALTEQQVTEEKEDFNHRVTAGEASHAERKKRSDAGTTRKRKRSRKEGVEGKRAEKRAKGKGKDKSSSTISIYKSSELVEDDSDDNEHGSNSDGSNH